MKRFSPFRYPLAVRFTVTFAFLLPRITIGEAQEHDDTGARSTTLPLSTSYVSKDARGPTRRSVRWKDQEYGVDIGVAVLMDVVRDPELTADERGLALTSLAMLETQLQGRPCMDELRKLYDTVGELEKRGILTCFLASRDPRGIPLFVRALDKEQDNYARLIAASGLIMWNARQGVAELISFLGSTEVPQSRLYPPIGDRAQQLFRTYNKRNEWGFSDEEIRNSIEAQGDLDEGQKRALYITEIKKWWAENEHRFPDWKPGDPLPEVPVGDNNKPTKE